MKNEPDYFTDQLENRGTFVGPDEGELLEANGLSVCFKITSDMTGDQLGLYELGLQAGAIGAKPHYHRFMDETFVVTKGVLTLQLGDEIHQAGPGAVIHVPRFTPHGFRNDTDEEARCLLIFNPSQKREGFFRGLYQTLSETPIDPAKYLQLYQKYDSFPVDVEKMIPVREP